MNKTLDSLEKKGWAKREIEKVREILERGHIKKTKNIIFLEKKIFWIALIAAFFGNIVIAAAIVPFLIALDTFYLYLTVAIIAVSFGLLFEVLIRDIEDLEPTHHMIAGLFLPITAIISVYISILVTWHTLFGINNINHVPFVTGLVYAVFFITPYLIYQTMIKKRI